ncbi:cation:proton antiporter [Acetobacterium woodii]|uniref:cation:proton antiporter n=1 Tax=Acetobacterium woodii TaxID=33952 RepID=UPI0011AE3FD3|nr:cation:proton antiporter [Acetobacterium woodii]
MEANIILEVSLMLFSGILFGRLAKFFKMPNVTGYLIAGLLLGPSFINIIPTEMVDGFGIISDIALGFIAFSVGSQFDLNYFKKVGIAPIVIATAEALGAVILVTVVMILFGFDTKLAIMLGAIAAATAPAQTIMVINQYRAKGPLTSMLMSVVAIDDAIALIAFGFASTLVNVMNSAVQTNIFISILSPFYEVLISFILGGIAAILMKILFRWFKKPSNQICIVIAFILMTYWGADMVHGSPLLACMALGGVLVNIYRDRIESVLKTTDAFSPPIFMVFFVISGAGFQISALPAIGLIGILYVVMRVIGKMSGAWLGGKLTHQSDSICKYLGPTLMPQAGVALGLVVVASKIVPNYADQIQVIILCSTFIYSIVGPIAAKIALVKSGEIVLPDMAVKNQKL